MAGRPEHPCLSLRSLCFHAGSLRYRQARRAASHDVPIIRRAILRYALSCPKQEAAAYVNQCRKRDPEMVKDTEELLKLEAPAPAPKQDTVSQPVKPASAPKSATVSSGANSRKG